MKRLIRGGRGIAAWGALMIVGGVLSTPLAALADGDKGTTIIIGPVIIKKDPPKPPTPPKQ